MPRRTLVLASRSPARLALLRAAGFAPHVVVSGVPEDHDDGSAADVALTLAERKASAVADRLLAGDAAGTEGGPAGPAPPALVLGCDSVLEVDGELRGKPSSAAEARRWWRSQRGREGTLVTGHAVVDTATDRRASDVAATVVRFGTPTDDEIDAYVATGEPLHVAGGFTLDGYAAPFVDGIRGDHGTVIGVSPPLLRRLLADVGIAITDLWDLP